VVFVARRDGLTEKEKSVGGNIPVDWLAIKKELGTLEYEFNAENFVRAVKDGNLPAVKLFLKAGMSADTKDGDQHAMVMGAMFCAYDPKPVRDEVVLALLAAKGNPNAADDNNATALLWAAENCGAEVIRAMIAAGANVNARAKGGGTPLTMADAFKRTEIVEILRAAGGKP
jgi:ankyrin repeat protein